MTDLLLLSVVFWLGIISAIIFSIQCYKARKVKEGKKYRTNKKLLICSISIIIISWYLTAFTLFGIINGLLGVTTCLNIVAIIIFLIRWFLYRRDKHKTKINRNIVIVLLLASLFLYGGEKLITYHITQQQKEEYLTSQRSFKACYEVTGSTTEELLNNEADEWYNALTQSNENAENAVITTTIKNKHDKEIKNIEKGLALIKTANQQIQNNDYATPEEKRIYHQAYLNIKHFTDHATKINGEYDNFIDQIEPLDDKCVRSFNKLKNI
ncbi:hypothetical protein [Limosilactobacillus reuteri]|uniref:hypothetical protein n=1 Tax=Limosilactobacillus reuteri TaxID=1598 RepID=UPI000B993042|nr:hypothetical protein [Limosilactobacillus reuteri]OYT02164.1 hypothetical protein CBG22_01465 [Limosilactobacillus reuteri]